ncbi:MaoC family dehydratase N-terminal domain-containing protein [Roseovarius sp.]|uniref:FAS1-like dehydratase domain-containing protein n=1 Tax=Roseovarius sp. TaxID=1486281 RepID=UPI00260E86D9|nr:MaoC family dehydratase N-terminal domain-containing protein [Roseovarius sp.]
MDKLNVAGWEGRTETQQSCISREQAAQIHATLGQPHARPPETGEVLPPLWHWCAFAPTVPLAELARDGHPMLGDFLPPVRLGRRMWASGRLRFAAPLRVGEALKRRSSIRSVREKMGRAGPMVLVSVGHQIFGERGLAVEEVQDIVYLDIPERFSPPPVRAMPDAPVLSESRTASEALLFRYSALTFNAHRIHYDLPYAQEVEQYPGLVVHGPLQATWLMQAACRARSQRPTYFDFRGLHPMLLTPGDGGQIDIMATEDDCGALSLVTGQGGHQCMQATAQWENTL